MIWSHMAISVTVTFLMSLRSEHTISHKAAGTEVKQAAHTRPVFSLPAHTCSSTVTTQESSSQPSNSMAFLAPDSPDASQTSPSLFASPSQPRRSLGRRRVTPAKHPWEQFRSLPQAEIGLVEWQAGISNKAPGLFLSIN